MTPIHQRTLRDQPANRLPVRGEDQGPRSIHFDAVAPWLSCIQVEGPGYPMASRDDLEALMPVVAQDVSGSHDILARIHSKGDMIQASMRPCRVYSKSEIVVKGPHREEGGYLELATVRDDICAMEKAQMLLEERAASPNIARG